MENVNEIHKQYRNICASKDAVKRMTESLEKLGKYLDTLKKDTFLGLRLNDQSCSEQTALACKLEELVNEYVEHVPVKKKENKWGEVHCDFFDENEKVWTVDAWLPDEEEGTVVAKITEAGDVIYLDEDARTDPLVQETISGHLQDIVFESCFPNY